MTEQDYILSKMTTFDKVKGNSIWAPLLTIGITVMLGLFELIDMKAIKLLVGLFIVLFMIAVALRSSLGKKIDRLKNEYLKLKS